jgi:hypothetical protein
MVWAGAWARAAGKIDTRRIEDAAAIRFVIDFVVRRGTGCYPSIIGLFRSVHAAEVGCWWVRSTVYVFFDFVRSGFRTGVYINGAARVRFPDFIFFDLRREKCRGLPAVPAVDAFQRPFPAAERSPFEAIKSVHGAGFVGQAAVGESQDRGLRFRGMDEPLTGGLIGYDAGFEVPDAP